MIVIKRGKEPNSLLKFRKENPDADYESDMPTDVLKDIKEKKQVLCWLNKYQGQINIKKSLSVVSN